MSITTTNNQEFVEFDEKKLALIRNTVCKDATPEEFEVFLEICKSTQLNPLFKQIYFIKRGGKPTHQTSIDGLRLIADRTKKYVPGREPTYTYDKSGILQSATGYVKKLASDGSWHEVAATAFLKEYDGKINLWKTMPHVMLAKCAEAAALRKAFPASMLGIYVQDEMDQAHPTAQNHTTIDVSPPSEQPPLSQAVEMITTEEAQEIENLIRPKDKEYRLELLEFFSNRDNSKIDSFFVLPRKYLKACMKSVVDRRQNKQVEAKPLDEQEIPF